MHICDYGCGQEAAHQFKNGKWCCSESWNACLVVRNKKSISLTGLSKSEEHKKKLSKSRIGKPGPNLGKVFGPHTEEWKRNHSEDMKGNKNPNFGKHMSLETKEKQRLVHLGKKLKMPKHFGEVQRKRMLNGGAIKALKGNKRKSKPELKLRETIKDIFPSVVHSYEILTYELDNAILEYKIAIEYDGSYFHNRLERIEHDNKRQRKIESLGWKFIKYIDFVPNKDKIKKDIENIIKEELCLV